MCIWPCTSPESSFAEKGAFVELFLGYEAMRCTWINRWCPQELFGDSKRPVRAALCGRVLVSGSCFQAAFKSSRGWRELRRQSETCADVL